jgi:small conductance mechanosensitive channel
MNVNSLIKTLGSIEDFDLHDLNLRLLINIMQIVAVLLVGWIIIRIIVHIEKKALKKSKLDDAAHVIIIRITRITLWVLLILTILSKTGISMAPFVALLGGGAAAIALGLKDSLGNVAGGIILIFTNPFTKGDEVELCGVSGIVQYIDLMTTRLLTFSNRLIVIPNGNIVTSVIVNHSAQDIRRVDSKVMIHRGSDVERTRVLLQEVAAENKAILRDPEPLIAVSETNADAICFDYGVWCSTPDRWDVKYYIEEAVVKKLSAAGINMPVSELDVKIVETERPVREGARPS